MRLGKYATAYSFEVVLEPAGGSDTYQSNPTIASGDFVCYRDGGSAETLDNLPAAIDAGKVVTITLSSAEMTAARILVVASDQAGSEWRDDAWEVQTFGNASAGINVALTGADGDTLETLSDQLDAVVSTVWEVVFS